MFNTVIGHKIFTIRYPAQKRAASALFPSSKTSRTLPFDFPSNRRDVGAQWPGGGPSRKKAGITPVQENNISQTG
jgi:hypothetical protein